MGPETYLNKKRSSAWEDEILQKGFNKKLIHVGSKFNSRHKQQSVNIIKGDLSLLPEPHLKLCSRSDDGMAKVYVKIPDLAFNSLIIYNGQFRIGFFFS